MLQIGADVYCDTHNIARCLAEHGGAKALFPDECQAHAMLWAQWVDQTLFPLAVIRLVWFHLADRSRRV